MAVSILALLGIGGVSAAASFPTGFGFGAGYGAGVRTGYDIIYPRIAPYAKEIIDFLIPNKGEFDVSQDRIDDLGDVTDPGRRFSAETQKIPGVLADVVTSDETSPQPGVSRKPQIEELVDPSISLKSEYNALKSKLVSLGKQWTNFNRIHGKHNHEERGSARNTRLSIIEGLTNAQQKLQLFVNKNPGFTP